QNAPDNRFSLLHMQYGQFIAHDVVSMPASTGDNGSPLNCSPCNSSSVSPDCMPIQVPDGDKFFPSSQCIRFARALNGQRTIGERRQLNQISAYLDLSTVYGADECTARRVRSFENGTLRDFLLHGNVMPKSKSSKQQNPETCRSSPEFPCFLVGERRSAITPGMLTLHTIFLREHNKIAGEMQERRPEWDDEKVFQETRRILIAIFQHITYNEYLPIVIGRQLYESKALRPLSTGYLPSEQASIRLEFNVAAFRFGHTTVRGDIPRLFNNGTARGSALNLPQHFSYADAHYEHTAGGINSIIEGQAGCPMMRAGLRMTSSMRNQALAGRSAPLGGIDLAAVNIQRGRDVGLRPYMDYVRTLTRRSPGIGRTTSALRRLYANMEDVDLYAGILTERAVPGGLVGPAAAEIIADQFRNLKVADRFYYENHVPRTQGFSEDELAEIRKMTLARLVCSNTEGMATVRRKIFELGTETEYWPATVDNEELKKANKLIVSPPPIQKSLHGDSIASTVEYKRFYV
ncbi:heme peroxidase, partial [Teladorsagia circumcincta]